MQTPLLIAQIILIILTTNLQRKLHLNMYFCFDLQKTPTTTSKFWSATFFCQIFLCCLIRQNEFT